MRMDEILAERIADSEITAGSATVATLSKALSSGVLRARQVTDFYLARIERLNPHLHAVITVSRDALAEAEASDKRRAAGEAVGPLDGIPVLIKDNISAHGMPATAGSPALQHAAAGDAFLVAGLRRAGAVIVGKANLSEWANFRSTHSSSGWSTLGGQVVNPHGEGRNPSGSSSGSAVAVAAGLAPAAVGTETDGSIVSPASACGVVGLKPTLGLVSRAGIVPISAAQDTAGPMTATVADAALLLTAMAGPDPADRSTAGSSVHMGDYAQVLHPGALAESRLGIWREGSATATPATTAVLEAAIARLRAGGAEVLDPVVLPEADKIGEPEFAALSHEFKHYINTYLADLGGGHPGSLAGLISFNKENEDTVLAVFGQETFESAEETNGDLADERYRRQRTEATQLAREALDEALSQFSLDAVVALTGSPAWLTDHVLGDHHVFSTSTPAAVAGYPAITVPAGRVPLDGSAGGLPVGVTFMGPQWSEPRLIALAHAFEVTGPAL